MYDMLQWAQDLFPIPRSLTGNGVRKTLDYLKAINNELVVHSFPTGATVFDWEVPKEWNIREAWFEHVESGERFAIFAESNLHILGYSVPVDKIIPKAELLKHIYTQPDQPDLIPYVTSYYKERWGFCITEVQKQLLPDGDYHVYIDSEHTHGELLVADALVSGASKSEIMFSSYICHPSMANNELSGPVLLSALLRYVKENIPNPNYSYRFILVPETIGSLAYMSRNLDSMRDNIIAGYNLSCVGDERAYSHIKSRFGANISDKALQAALLGKENVRQYSFLETRISQVT
jgi:aminopeptidase-like protein